MERYRDSTDPPTNGISNASKSALWIGNEKPLSVLKIRDLCIVWRKLVKLSFSLVRVKLPFSSPQYFYKHEILIQMRGHQG